ncbi:hypothetical protein EJB05_25411, partial [Eragrostis curvula]
MGRDMPAITMLNTDDKMKTSWPEVVGMAVFPAAMKIAHDRPDVTVEFLGVGERVPPGYNNKRVRVIVNHDATTPTTPSPRRPSSASLLLRQAASLQFEKERKAGMSKTSWPELVGSPGEYAHDMIKKDRPDIVEIPVLLVGTQVPPGYDDQRVRLFVHPDFNHKVALTPVVG